MLDLCYLGFLLWVVMRFGICCWVCARNWCDFLIFFFFVQGCEWRWKLVEVGYGVAMVGLWCYSGVICEWWFVSCVVHYFRELLALR